MSKTKTVVAIATLTTGTPAEPESVPPGEEATLDAKEADRLVNAGLAKWPDPPKKKSRPASSKKELTAEAIQKALLEEIYPNLTEEEKGEDGVPNVKVVAAKLKEHFSQTVPFDGPARDASWGEFTKNSEG